MSQVAAKASEIPSSTFISSPDHLLVLVHGILASPNDWSYVERQLKKELNGRFLVHASAVNSYLQTFSGIDVAGRRLAEEVEQVVKENSSLKRISFLSHSLGGLFARYAIAIGFSSQDESLQKTTVAGLEPISFITLATPHLGVRGRKQLPFLFGIPFLEWLAPTISYFLVGRTGPQLFLTDGEADEAPLLLRMASDSYDLKFISSLRSFRSRVCYANVGYDHMVGWCTSSIRRENELPKIPKTTLEGYDHVVNSTYYPPMYLDMPSRPKTTKDLDAKAARILSTAQSEETCYENMEENMIQGLQEVGWCKVDVSFHSVLWPFSAHHYIHVKQEWFHSAGAGVVAHVADSLKQEVNQTAISPNL